MSETPGTISNYLFQYFYLIKMWTETEDVHVIKLVDLVARNPKHLSLHFSDFSMNCYEFSNFAAKFRKN